MHWQMAVINDLHFYSVKLGIKTKKNLFISGMVNAHLEYKKMLWAFRPHQIPI